MGLQYKTEEFSDILFAGYEYKLPEQVINKLNDLIRELGVNVQTQSSSSGNTLRNTDNRSTGFRKPAPGLFKRVKPNPIIRTNQTISDEQWNRVKEFKTTRPEKREGVEKAVCEIRASLNKMSEKSYQTQFQNIKNYIDQVAEDYLEKDVETNITHPEFLKKIANFIVDVASTNKLNSVLYSNIYKELILHYPILQDFVSEIVIKYVESIKNIKYVDNNVDYDLFCDNNKENDKRKALVVFLVNLTNIDVLPKESIKDVIIKLLDQIFQFMDIPNKTNEVDEITENIFIFLKMMKSDLLANDSWGTIKNNIETIQKFKTNQHVSLSSRAIFKYMDML